MALQSSAACLATEDTEGAGEDRVSPAAARRGAHAGPALVSSRKDGELLRVVMRPAAELFPSDTPNAVTSLLGFEVPFFERFGQHPKVPSKNPTYAFPSRELAWALITLIKGRIPWLYGMPGTGKTTLPEQIAAALNWPLERINFDRFMRRAEILGSVRPQEGERGGITASFLSGTLPTAMEDGCLTLFDEISQGATELMSVLTRVMEGKGLLLLEDGARIVKPTMWFRVIATCNTIGRGAGDSLFNNTNELSLATRDRISTWIEIKHLPEDLEVKTVVATVEAGLPNGQKVDAAFVRKSVKLANEIRSLFRTRQVDDLISLRSLFDMAEYQATLSGLYPDARELEIDLLTRCVLNRFTDDAKETVRRKANAVFNNILPDPVSAGRNQGGL